MKIKIIIIYNSYNYLTKSMYYIGTLELKLKCSYK